MGGEGTADADNCIHFLSGNMKVRSWGMRKDPPECGFTTEPMTVFYSSLLVLDALSTQ